MRKIIAAILIVGFGFGLAQGLGQSSAQAEQFKNFSIKSRPGVTIPALLLSVDKPKAAVVMFSGGPGKANISGTSVNGGRAFVGANFKNLAAYGLSVIVVDVPSDRSNGLSPRYRQTKDHLVDLESIIARVAKETNLPVWLMGISRATISVFHAALNSKQPIAGIIALSSIVRIPAHTGVTRLTDLPLEKIRVPAFTAGHEDDGCRGTPAEGARELARGMVNSPKAEAKIFSGGNDGGRNPCGPGSPHTFTGIQDVVVDKIAEFIIVNSRAIPD